MLNLSANGDYGLMLLRELAGTSEGQYLSLAELAKERHLPRKYLDHVAKRLVRANIIIGQEGRGGGYALNKPVKQIKFVDVLQALEGGVTAVNCTHNGKCCQRQSACARKTGWQKVQSELYELIEKKTLADVLSSVAKS